jgi:hypothetical protein
MESFEAMSARTLEEAFERGRAVGRREGLAFEGIPPCSPWTTGASFRFERSWFDSFVAYERELLEQLRALQQQRWLQSLDPATRSSRNDIQVQVAGLVGRLQHQIERELRSARSAVDAELETGRGRSCTVAAMRAAPNRPVGVREVLEVGRFVADDPRRSLPDWPARRDAGGADYGWKWRLEDPLRPWTTSRWRVSWLCIDDPTYEVYAIERLKNPFGRGPNTGRVWLFGVLRDHQFVDTALRELERYAQAERNSLVVVAKAVRDAARR